MISDAEKDLLSKRVAVAGRRLQRYLRYPPGVDIDDVDDAEDAWLERRLEQERADPQPQGEVAQ